MEETGNNVGAEQLRIEDFLVFGDVVKLQRHFGYRNRYSVYNALRGAYSRRAHALRAYAIELLKERARQMELLIAQEEEQGGVR